MQPISASKHTNKLRKTPDSR